jgi:hypothetical protein
MHIPVLVKFIWHKYDRAAITLGVIINKEYILTYYGRVYSFVFLGRSGE